MIRSTFTAMPARRLVLAAKAAVTAAFVFPVALLSNLVSFEVGQRIFAAKHLQVSLGHPGVLQAVVFGAVAVSLIAVIGVGLGGIIRHTAGATTALILVIIGGVMFGQLLPAGFRQYLPGTALQAAVTVHRSAGLLTPAPPSWSSACTPPSPWRRHRSGCAPRRLTRWLPQSSHERPSGAPGTAASTRCNRPSTDAERPSVPDLRLNPPTRSFSREADFTRVSIHRHPSTTSPTSRSSPSSSTDAVRTLTLRSLLLPLGLVVGVGITYLRPISPAGNSLR